MEWNAAERKQSQEKKSINFKSIVHHNQQEKSNENSIDRYHKLIFICSVICSLIG